MSGIKSISEVKDLYDLIDLYAHLDDNADGLLEAGEVSAEEIAAGDKGGIGSANYDVKDGFLSPWEVAEMRGFKWEDVRSLRIVNQIHRRTFSDIESLSNDLSIGGCVFQSGASLSFHANGKIRDGVLGKAKSFSYGADKSVQLPPGTKLLFGDEGKLKRAVLASVMKVGKDRYPAGSIFHYDHDAQFLRISPPTGGTLIIDGHRSSSVYMHDAVIEYELAEGASIDCGIPPNDPFYVPVPKASVVRKGIDENVQFIALGARRTIFGFDCPMGTILEFPGGYLKAVLASKNAPIERHGLSLSYVEISLHIEGAYGILDNATTVRFGDFSIPFAADGVSFSRNGSIMSGTLAEDLKNPYSSKRIPAGDLVHFLDDGTLIEESESCFRKLFPHIRTSGDAPSLGTIRGLSRLSPRMRSHIKGVYNKGFEEWTSSSRGGFANPVTMVISVTGIEGNLVHEASHIHHYSIQREYAERIAAATRFLDPSDPTHQAEIHAIETSIMSRSFDGRWSRASGVSFHYSMADLASAGINYLFYGSNGFCTSQNLNSYFDCYQSTSIWEDVAVSIQLAMRKPQEYAQLLDPSSHYYKKYPEKRPFVGVFRMKLELLREYGFITEEIYREIVPVHPATAAFCASEGVNCP